jgi:hypothetical protein
MPRLRKSTSLKLQRLDDRITPAVNVTLLPSGVLNVTGFPANVLTVEQTANNKLTVYDGAISYGPYNAPTGLNVQITSFKQAVLFNTKSFTYSGNVTFDLGLGSTFAGTREVSIFDDDGASGGLGRILGNVTIRNGSGSEVISIGRPAAIATIDLPVQVNGNVNVTTRNNAGLDQFELVPGSIVQSSIYLTNLDLVSLGFFNPGNPTMATVGGNVVVSTPTPQSVFSVDVYANLNGSLTVTSQAASNKLAVLTFNDGTTVGGNVTTLFANGGSFINFGTNVAGHPAPFFNGSVNIISGIGNDYVYIAQDPFDFDAATINGSATFNLGQGDNQFFFDFPAFVGGNLSVSAGNGANFLGGTQPPNFAMEGIVNGNFNVSLGNGDNTVNFGAFVFGKNVTIQTGGGNDLINITNTAFAFGAKLSVFAGAGNDTLNVFSVSFASAYLDGGFGTDDYNLDPMLTWLTPVTVINWEL